MTRCGVAYVAAGQCGRVGRAEGNCSGMLTRAALLSLDLSHGEFEKCVVWFVRLWLVGE